MLGTGRLSRRGCDRDDRDLASARPASEIDGRITATLTVINANSPLRLDIPMGEGLLRMARAGQPVVA